MKKINYVNKCKIDLTLVEEFLKKPIEEILGKRIIAIQENDFVSSGIIMSEQDLVLFFNYTDHKFESLQYLLSLKNVEEADVNLYDYEEFKNSISEKTNKYDALKALNYGFKYVVLVDDLNIVIDAEDEEFERNTLNLLTFDESIDYYSMGSALVVQDNCKTTEIQTMQHYPASRFSDNHFIELQAYDIIDRVQYMNYHFNIEYYLHGEKLAPFK